MISAARAGGHDALHQAEAPALGERVEARHEAVEGRGERGAPVDHLLLQAAVQLVQHAQGRAAGEGAAAEGGAVVAGDQGAGVGAAGQGRPDGQPGADGLGEGDHVGGQAVVGAGQERAGAPAAALDLVRDHDGPGLGAQLTRRGHVVRVQGLDAALPLDRLHDERRGPFREGRLEGADVVGLEELRGQALPERRAVGGVGP